MKGIDEIKLRSKGAYEVGLCFKIYAVLMKKTFWKICYTANIFAVNPTAFCCVPFQDVIQMYFLQQILAYGKMI